MGQVNTSPLFVGLTRPTMMFGVTMEVAMLNICISMGAVLAMHNMIFILLGVALHFGGYLICYHEPRFLQIYGVRMGKCPSCINKMYYGANSYSV